jgi:hypothetical protein
MRNRGIDMRRDERGAIPALATALTITAAALGIAAAAAGCGRVVAADSGVALSAAPLEIAQAVCPKAYSCCTASDLMGNDLAGTDEPSCEVATAKSFSDQLAAVQDAQDAGRARYDGARVAACLATIRAATCETLGQTNHLAGIPGCDSFVEPLVDEAGTCVNDWECKVGRCQAGKCEALPAAGAPCADKRCADGAVCDPSGACVAARAQGDSCAQAAQCPSLQCTNGTCAPRAATCFYASGCSVAGAGADAGLAAALLTLAALVLAALRRPRSAAATAARRRAARARAGGR